MNRILITRNDEKWQGHPDVAFFNNRVYIVYRDSDKHLVSGETIIWLICGEITKDDTFNQIWEKPIHQSDCRLNCPRLSVINDELWIVCDEVGKEEKNYLAAENVENNTKIILWRSEDGEKWSEPIDTNITGIVPDRICQFGGRFLIATHTKFIPPVAIKKTRPKNLHDFEENYKIEQNSGRLIQNVWITKDLTEEWTQVALANRPSFNFCEASLMRWDKALLCFIRENSGKGLPAFMSISLNGGNTWSEPQTTRLFGCHRPVCGQLRSGNILVTYREQSSVMAPSHWARNTFAAIINKDSVFSSCNKSVILPLDHDANKIKSDSGYTGWIQLPNGKIFIVNYITDDAPKPYICGYVISEHDF